MDESYVKLTSTANAVQEALIEEILRDEQIPYRFQEPEGSLSAILGTANPLTAREVHVPTARVQEAKDLLCGHGVVCEVSERLLRRSLDEIVLPLLAEYKDGATPPAPDLERLVYFLGINNKETVHALFEATVEQPGGPALLRDLFFRLTQDEAPALPTLARTLGRDESAEFGARFLAQLHSASVVQRVRMLDVLPELPATAWRTTALLAGLRDTDTAVRTAAGEALFTIRHGNDGGYDPEAPPEEREQVVARMQRAGW